MSHRHELTDAQWARLAPLLPPQKPATGRPARDHRQMLNAMLWLHATGAQWRDLPERYGPWQSVATRFYRWVQAGVWDAILAALQRQGDAAGRLDWSAHFVDGTVIRAHQHAAGARRARGGAQQALGRSRGGFTTKLHVRAERGGKPLAVLLTAGERHEQSVFEPLMECGAVTRPGGRGRPRQRPRRVVGDKGYSSGTVRRYLRRRGIGATIPKKRDERPQRTFDRALYRERNTVERCINRLKQFRRVATRYEKLAVNYLAMVTIAAILIWL
jgi:transposase